MVFEDELYVPVFNDDINVLFQSNSSSNHAAKEFCLLATYSKQQLQAVCEKASGTVTVTHLAGGSGWISYKLNIVHVV